MSKMRLAIAGAAALALIGAAAEPAAAAEAAPSYYLTACTNSTVCTGPSHVYGGGTHNNMPTAKDVSQGLFGMSGGAASEWRAARIARVAGGVAADSDPIGWVFTGASCVSGLGGWGWF